MKKRELIRKRVVLSGIAVACIILIVFFMLFVVDIISQANLIIAVVLTITTLLFIVMSLRQLLQIKQKKVVKDELSRKIIIYAGYLTFRFSIFFWLLLMFVNLLIEGYTNYLLIAGILFMGIINIILRLYLNKSGNVYEE